jgi:hypothetical protein
MFNNAATLHALTGEDPYREKAREESHFFTFYNRYDGETFQGIIPDTGAAGTSTAGELQVKALQRKLPYVTINTATAGNHKVRFGDGPEKSFLGTANVQTPFGTINFAIMPINTLFLLCLANMNRHNVYYNNVDNMLMQNGKIYPVIREWGYLWLFLEDHEPAIACSHLTEGELRQLHRRFGHSAADRLHKVLSRAGYNNVKEFIIIKINKYCY